MFTRIDSLGPSGDAAAEFTTLNLMNFAILFLFLFLFMFMLG
jgi:hypothetical protein